MQDLAQRYALFTRLPLLQGIGSRELLGWEESLRLYLGTDDEDRLKEVQEKAMLIGYTRIMRRRIRRNGFDTEEGRLEIENAKNHILELVDKLDTLTF